MHVTSLTTLTVALMSLHFPVGLGYFRLGALLAGRRPRRARWTRASRALALPACIASAVAVPAIIAPVLGGALSIARPHDAWWVVVWLLCGAPATTGVYLLLRSGRLEAGGRLRPARRLAGTAGRAACLGSLSLAASGLFGLFALDHGRAGAVTREWFLLGGGVAALCAAGMLALLAGLSGKPRPAGQVAAAMLLAGQLALGSVVAT